MTLRHEVPQFEPNQKKTFEVAKNVTMPKYLDYLAEGFDFFDQPPLNWILSEPELIPSFFFVEGHEEIGIKAILKALVISPALKPPNWDLKKAKKAKTQAFALKHIDPELQFNNDLPGINFVLTKIWQYLELYPFLLDYLQQNLSFNARFAVDGSFTDSTSTPNKFQLKSYAAHLGSKSILDQKLVGLNLVVPDHSADEVEFSFVVKEESAPDAIAFPIIRFLSADSDSSPEEK